MFRSTRAGRLPARRHLGYALTAALFLGTFTSSSAAHAQFRNNGIQLPAVGYTGMGWSTDWLFNGLLNQQRWGTSDQVNLGVGYFRAVGYNLWLDNQVLLGAGTGLSVGATQAPVFSLMISTGLRYNFLDEKHRPYVMGHIQYLQLFYDPSVIQDIPRNDVLQGASLWVGPRLGAGYEWFFAEEMSFQGELGAAAFFNFVDIRVSPLVRASYNVYF